MQAAMVQMQRQQMLVQQQLGLALQQMNELQDEAAGTTTRAERIERTLKMQAAVLQMQQQQQQQQLVQQQLGLALQQMNELRDEAAGTTTRAERIEMTLKMQASMLQMQQQQQQQFQQQLGLALQQINGLRDEAAVTATRAERAEQKRSDLTCLQLKSGHGDSGLVDTKGVGQPFNSPARQIRMASTIKTSRNGA